MSLERQILVWVAALAAFWWLLHLLGSAVTPFAAGIALGYLLDPVVRRLERIGLSRLAASLVPLGAFVFVVVLGIIPLRRKDENEDEKKKDIKCHREPQNVLISARSRKSLRRQT